MELPCKCPQSHSVPLLSSCTLVEVRLFLCSPSDRCALDKSNESRSIHEDEIQPVVCSRGVCDEMFAQGDRTIAAGSAHRQPVLVSCVLGQTGHGKTDKFHHVALVDTSHVTPGQAHEDKRLELHRKKRIQTPLLRVPLPLLRVEPGREASSEAAFGVPAGSERRCVRPRCAVSGLRTSFDKEGTSGPADWEVISAGPRAASMHGAQKGRGRVATASATPRFGRWDPCENPGLQPNSWNSYHGLNGTAPGVRYGTSSVSEQR